MTDDQLYFDTIAYDFERRINPFDLKKRLEWFTSQLDRLNIRGKEVLDVGCGLGHFSDLVSERGGIPIPLDLGAKLVKKVSERIPTCVQGDALNLPFQDNFFPFVISSECIEHTREPMRAIREMIRVLRPGGILIFSTPNYIWRWSITIAKVLKIRKFAGIENWLRPREVRDVLVESGMEILIAEGLFIFPFQIKLLWPVIDWFNKYAQFLRRFMINQCWVVRKRQSKQ